MCSSANAYNSASYVANNHGRIHENSARHLCVNSHDSTLLLVTIAESIRIQDHVGVNTHISTPTVFPKPGSIKWQLYFSGTYDVFLSL